MTKRAGDKEGEGDKERDCFAALAMTKEARDKEGDCFVVPLLAMTKKAGGWLVSFFNAII